MKKLRLLFVFFITLSIFFSFNILFASAGKKGEEEKKVTAPREDTVTDVIEEGTMAEEKGEEEWWKAPSGGSILVSELPEPDKNAGPFTIAFVCNDVKDAFNIDVWNGFKEAAKEYPKLDLHMFDSKNNPEDSIKAVMDVQALNPDLAIYFNWVAAGDVLAAWCEENQTPLIEIDAPWGENAWFFGLDNKLAGQLGGEAIAEWVNRNWKGEDIWIINATEYESGEVVYYRNSEFLKRFLELKDDSIEVQNLHDNGKVDELNAPVDAELGMQLFTDWLTAHPQADHFVVWGTTDTTVSGMYSAAVNQNRVDQGVFGSINGTTYATDIMKVDDSYLGTITMFPEFYGRNVLKTAYCILTGIDVPKIVITTTIFMTMDELCDYYPERCD